MLIQFCYPVFFTTGLAPVCKFRIGEVEFVIEGGVKRVECIDNPLQAASCCGFKSLGDLGSPPPPDSNGVRNLFQRCLCSQLPRM